MGTCLQHMNKGSLTGNKSDLALEMGKFISKLILKITNSTRYGNA
jgi:hypothetical protein